MTGGELIRCGNEHKEELLDFLTEYPAENCFLIGDVENFDLTETFLDIWITRNEGKITSLLCRFFRFYQTVSRREDDLEKIASKIRENREAVSVSGMTETMKKLSDHIAFESISHMILSELIPSGFQNPEKHLISSGMQEVQRASVEDLEELFIFQKGIKEFSLTDDHRDTFGQDVKTGTGRIFYIRDSGRIICSATVTAENSINGAVLAVATADGYRRKGYARTCLGTLCRELTGEGKSLVLFYHNKAAGRLYSSLGFKDIGGWSRGILKAADF